MTGGRKREIELFAEAIQLSNDARIAFLNRLGASDEGLRRRIEKLLRSNDRAGEFLETPPTGALGAVRAKVSAGEKAGGLVDRYRLLKQIGEGGCGIVFIAEQETPVRRQVALKVIKPGMDTSSIIARFEAERQALALMDHPNVARIFDAGTTGSGRPYFVMELIHGVKITDHCDQNSLTTRERLKLFAQVCQAIQHAHQKGIIHRDIKPSNILVSTTTGTAVPVIIDFGIAKATANQVLSDKTVFTSFEMLMGTPAYMSPEQATLNSVDLDTRTDIYSLGVLLYELLTGSTPFEMEEALKVGLDEIRRVIREKEPARPSTRLGKLKEPDLTIIAQRRQSEAPALIRALRGDLDWITMKALEKDRTRRYATANGFAVDIQRFLADETVSARPPSKLYKFKKTARRNKLLFTAVSVIVLLLVGGLIAVSALLAKEQKARRKSDAVTQFLKKIFEGAGPFVSLGEDSNLLKRLLDENVPRLDKELAAQPLVEAELCTLIGKLYGDMGHADKGAQMAQRAVAINRAAVGSDSLVTAASLQVLGVQLTSQYRYAEAEKAYIEALAIRRRHLGSEHLDTAASCNDLARLYRREGRLKEAEDLAREGLEIRLKLDTNGLEVVDSMRNLALILGGRDKWVEAENLMRKALEMRRKLLPPLHPWLAAAMEDDAWALNGLGRYEEAQALDEQALVMRQKLLGDDHPDVLRTGSALGQLLRNRGDFKTSEAVLKAVLSMQIQVQGEQSPATLDTFSNLAELLQREGRWAEAESTRRQIVALWRKKGGLGQRGGLFALRGLADVLELEGKWLEAERVWRESVPLWRKLDGIEGRESMYTLRKLALALEAEHKWRAAEAVHREALSISSKKGDDDPEALTDLERVIGVLMAQNQFTEALALVDKVCTPGFLAKPASARVLAQKVNLMGRRKHWQEAAEAAALALEKQPDEHYRYHTLAALLAVTHNAAGYEAVCQQMVSRFCNSTNPYVAERIADDCLLQPNPKLDLRLMDKLADVAVSAGNGTDGLPYFHACKAMVLYRQGRFPAAIAWAGKATDSSVPFAQAKGYAVLAMARWKLGRKSEARSALQKGDALAPVSPQMGAEDLGESWVAWLMARISLDEAAALMRTPASAQSRSNRLAQEVLVGEGSGTLIH